MVLNDQFSHWSFQLNSGKKISFCFKATSLCHVWHFRDCSGHTGQLLFLSQYSTHDNLSIGPVGASMAILQVASDNTFPYEVPMWDIQILLHPVANSAGHSVSKF